MSFRLRVMPVMTEGVDDEMFLFFVPTFTLLQDFHLPGEHDAVVPWFKWGPDGTRLLPIYGAATRARIQAAQLPACGTRYVVPPPMEPDAELATVYDFNPFLRPRLGWTIHREPTVIDDWVFANIVSTCLPYSSRLFPVPSAADLWQMLVTEDSLVCIDANSPNFRLLSF